MVEFILGHSMGPIIALELNNAAWSFLTKGRQPMKKWFGLAIGVSFAAVLLIPDAGAQALGNWSSPRNNMEHNGWQKAETIISKENLSGKFKFLWKLKPAHAGENVSSYSEPLLVPRLINSQGFKDFVIWAGPQDVYAADSELGRMIWTKHYDATSSGCGATNLGIIAEAPPTINFRARRRPAGSAPPPPPPGPMKISERRVGVSAGGGGFGIRGLYVLTGDGYLHEQVIATGADFAPAVKFLSGPVGISRGLGLDRNLIYTATTSGCNGVKNALWAMTMNGTDYPVASYKTGTIAPLIAMGPTLDADIAYAVTGSGKSDTPEVHADSIVALGPDAKVKDWYEAGGSLQNVTPVVFTYNQKKLLAAPGKDGSYVLLDTESLGGSDHRTPLASTPQIAKAKDKNIAALASWQDSSGTWVLASVPGPINSSVKFANTNGVASHGSIVAFKVQDTGGKTELVPEWVSRDLVNPAPPVIANGLVIALSQGDASTHATLFVLDAATGKELYSSGDAIPTYAHMAGVAVGDGHVFFVTHDNTLYSFGIGMEH